MAIVEERGQVSRNDRPVYGMPRLPRDVYVAIGTIILCCALLFVTTTFDQVPKALARGMQPADYPRYLLGAIIVLSACLAIQSLVRRAQNSKTKEKAIKIPSNVWKTGLLMLVCTGAFQILGAFPAMVIASAVQPALWGLRRPVMNVLFAILFPLAVYTLFSLILGVRFPEGLIPMPF
ncbi:tripartite tricarboxylate transporter TctB family protein [uncultured Cohaesibacter sp.]|uniref:tripartite tricarboxylate transporter TctB family protein n=1 Tax=uncultured Cohaesibacter sp. TaxID=1002546 RepID=UPI0029C71E26|nr:tripartite tricarboxylate transporter TctB family protein [uncultured Cohaesibacter sp.]